MIHQSKRMELMILKSDKYFRYLNLNWKNCLLNVLQVYL